MRKDMRKDVKKIIIKRKKNEKRTRIKRKENKEERKRTSHSATRLYTGRESGVADTGVVSHPGPSGLAVAMHECQKGHYGLVSSMC